MKGNKTKTLIVALVAALVLVGIGFAAFSETLTINGTANTSGDFDVLFQSATAVSTTACTPTATISGDSNTLTLDVADLEYPGAGTSFDIVVENAGTIDAIINAVTLTGDTTDPDVTVTVPSLTGTQVAAGGTHTFTIDVAWDAASTTGSKTISYTVELDYDQDTP